MNENDVKAYIEEVRKELTEYSKQRNDEFNKFMLDSGAVAFMQETEKRTAFLQGKIAALEGLLPKEVESDETLPGHVTP